MGALQLWNQGATMQNGIALLLKNARPDLAATVQAIELAQRTGGVVHAVYTDPKGPGSEAAGEKETNDKSETLLARILSLAAWWSERREVKVHLHLFEDFADASLLRLCRTYRVSCLVTGVGSRNGMKRETLRVLRLRKMALEDSHAPQVLWSVIIPAWRDSGFESVIDHFEKVVWQKQSASSGLSSARHEQ